MACLLPVLTGQIFTAMLKASNKEEGNMEGDPFHNLIYYFQTLRLIVSSR